MNIKKLSADMFEVTTKRIRKVRLSKLNEAIELKDNEVNDLKALREVILKIK